MPNGREPDSDHYRYKLAWLASLREVVAARPDAAIVCGDMNIAPADDGRLRPGGLRGPDPRDPAEREALAELEALGLHDVVRDRWPDERVFTYWDYRAGMFHQDLGMRIDLILASDPVAARVKAAWIDRKARKGTGPSDHAPVIVDLDEAPDGDIGPVVPPPSAPAAPRGTDKLPQSRDSGRPAGEGLRVERAAAVRGASRASRGGPGRLWPPRDARDEGFVGKLAQVVTFRAQGARSRCDGSPKRSRTSVSVLRSRDPRTPVVDEDAGNVTPSGPQRPGIGALERVA